jgi:hypothetical protein
VRFANFAVNDLEHDDAFVVMMAAIEHGRIHCEFHDHKRPINMGGAWYFLDPYFRSPLWLAFGAVTILWSTFNVWLMGKYPDYVPTNESNLKVT